MSGAHDHAARFAALHARGRPLVLFNVWDAGSARAVAAGCAQAIATSSWAVAHTMGYGDGEQVPLAEVLSNLRRIVRSVDLPVSVDIESGYGLTPADVGATIERTIEAGAIGCNIEDSLPGTTQLRTVAEQAQRIGAARMAAERARLPYFINARTDVFFEAPPTAHDLNAVERALERARAYAQAGANCLFVPGLEDACLIARLAEASPLPINVMVGTATPSLAELARTGVVRVSHGALPCLRAMQGLQQASSDALKSA